MNACPNHKHLRIKVKQFTNEMRRNKRKCPQDDICSSLIIHAPSKDLTRTNNHGRKMILRSYL